MHATSPAATRHLPVGNCQRQRAGEGTTEIVFLRLAEIPSGLIRETARRAFPSSGVNFERGRERCSGRALKPACSKWSEVRHNFSSSIPRRLADIDRNKSSGLKRKLVSLASRRRSSCRTASRAWRSTSPSCARYSRRSPGKPPGATDKPTYRLFPLGDALLLPIVLTTTTALFSSGSSFSFPDCAIRATSWLK